MLLGRSRRVCVVTDYTNSLGVSYGKPVLVLQLDGLSNNRPNRMGAMTGSIRDA